MWCYNLDIMFDPLSVKRTLENNQRRSALPKSGKDGEQVVLQVKNGFVQWGYKSINTKWQNLIALKDLEGAKGPKGPQGLPGQPGAQGPKGDVGPRGADGKDGTRGPQGIKGDPGIDGLDGLPGKDGQEIELQTSPTHIQWRYKSGGGWQNLILLTQLKGPKGEKGDRGEQGERGLRGIDGAPGTRGPQGYTGLAGPQGPAGVGVPAGGTTGQVPAKASDDDYDVEWVDQTGSGNSGMRLADGPVYESGFCYVGYEHETNGSWYIYRRTRATNLRQYATGLTDYATNWTNRGSLSYA